MDVLLLLFLAWLFGGKAGAPGAVPPPFPGPAPIPPGVPPVPVPAPPPAPAPPATLATYTIKSGDTPFGLAQRATGQGSRHKELLPVNPELKVVNTRDSNGVIVATHYLPFNPGQVLKLPASWPPLA